MDKNYGFFRVAAAVPWMRVADPSFTAERIVETVKCAEKELVSLVVFPELCLTGYTCGDLFFQEKLQEVVNGNLEKLIKESKTLRPAFIVGLPLSIGDKLFNVAALVKHGKLYGIVPKVNLPNYKEFYEARWFASGRDLQVDTVDLFRKKVPIGTDLIFELSGFDAHSRVNLAIEICEDLWVPIPPSSHHALRGATLLANLSASNAVVGKAAYRRNLVAQQSGRCVAGYIYASSGVRESSTDTVFDGHCIIAENGGVLVESKRFSRDEELVIADIDMDHLRHDRKMMSTFRNGEAGRARVVPVHLLPARVGEPKRKIERNPFVPSDPKYRDEVCEDIFSIQVAGLEKRLAYVKRVANMRKLVLGLSGGLDSTLALLVGVQTLLESGVDPGNLDQCMKTFTLPGFGTTSRTKENAKKLAKALGVSIEEVDITKVANGMLADLKHDPELRDITYENVQARYRTNFLMNKANQLRGLTVGTGDMSESALGWCTFAGDHISFYNPNAGVPKTLVKYLVRWYAEKKASYEAREVLEDILDTPISPELIAGQETEEKIGPYELHDFFLYHFLRWGSPPRKILLLAYLVWRHKYSRDEIRKWLKVFAERFFKAQWKRSVASDGPKIGSVALSPRGDWRMPSDAEMTIWLDEIDEL
jgi:NAD+ synthase (glutamine-hydrolysing)